MFESIVSCIWDLYVENGHFCYCNIVCCDLYVFTYLARLYIEQLHLHSKHIHDNLIRHITSLSQCSHFLLLLMIVDYL